MADRTATLESMVRGLGVPYQLQQEGPDQHAVFEVEPAGWQRRMTCSATLRGGALRLTAHDLIAAEVEGDDARLWRLNDINLAWCFGRIYLEAERGAFEVAAGLLVEVSPPAPPAIAATVAHLAAAAQAISANQTPTLALPVTPAALDRVADALRAAGLDPMHRDEAVLGLRLPVPGGPDFVVELSLLQGSLLVVRAREANPDAVVEGPETAAQLQVINRGLTFGSVAIQREQGCAVYTMGVPLPWVSVDARLVRWLVRKAATMVEMLDGAL